MAHMRLYGRIEIIIHQDETTDDFGLAFTEAMLANVDSEDFEWWYDAAGCCHIGFNTQEAAEIGSEVMKDMANGEWGF